MFNILDDIQRGRSKIVMVLRRTEIINTPVSMEASQILFGDKAEQKGRDYVDTVLKD